MATPSHVPTSPTRLLIEGEAGAVILLAELAQRLGLAATILPEPPEPLPDDDAEPLEQLRPEAENIGWAKGSVHVGPDLFKDDNVR